MKLEIETTQDKDGIQLHIKDGLFTSTHVLPRSDKLISTIARIIAKQIRLE